MRVAGLVFGEQAHVLQGLVDLGDSVLFVFIQMEVVQALGDTVFNGGTLVEGGGRVLEDHLDIPDHVAVLLAGDLAGDALSLEEDLAGAAGVDAKDRAAQRGLAGAGFAHQREGLTLIDVEISVFYGD